jgi:hypothetical protein
LVFLEGKAHFTLLLPLAVVVVVDITDLPMLQELAELLVVVAERHLWQVALESLDKVFLVAAETLQTGVVTVDTLLVEVVELDHLVLMVLVVAHL